ALRVERGRNGCCRGEGDVVLARPPARQNGEPHPAAHGGGGWMGVVVVSVGVVVVGAVVVGVVGVAGVVTSGGGTYVPTVSFTTVFGSAWAFPAGSWLITSPSSASSSVSWSVTLDLKPAARSVARASATLWSE